MNENIQKMVAAGITVLGVGGAGAIATHDLSPKQDRVDVVAHCEAREVEAAPSVKVVQSETGDSKLDNATGW